MLPSAALVALVLRGSKVEKYTVVVGLHLEQPPMGFDIGRALMRDVDQIMNRKEWSNIELYMDQNSITDAELAIKSAREGLLQIPMTFEFREDPFRHRASYNFYIKVESHSNDSDEKFRVVKELKQKFEDFLNIVGYYEELIDSTEINVESY